MQAVIAVSGQRGPPPSIILVSWEAACDLQKCTYKYKRMYVLYSKSLKESFRKYVELSGTFTARTEGSKVSV